MKRIIWCTGFLLLTCSLLTGCWDRRELNDVGIVTGMAIDKGSKAKFKLSVEALNVTEISSNKSGGGGGNTASVVYSQEGDTIAEMARRMNTLFTRKLIYSHMRTVAISEEIAREGVVEFFDFMERDREIRNDFNVLVVKGHQAADVLRVSYPLQKVSTMKLNSQLNTLVKDYGGDPDVRLRDIIAAWVSKGREPVSAVVSIVGPVSKGNSTENMKKITPDANVQAVGMALFKGLKLKGFLPIKDVRNFLWTQDKLKRTTVSVPCGNNNRFFAVRVYRSQTDTKAYFKNKQPHIDVTIRFEAFINVAQCSMDPSKLDAFQQYEKMASKYIEKDITQTISKVQHDYQSDIFGFGEVMNRQNHSEFKKIENNWNNVFAKAKITVKVKANIRRAGLIKNPFINEMKKGQ